MGARVSFSGFPKESVEFYTALAANNNKTWFDGHKGDFEKHVMAPARDFVFEMGKRLAKIAPGVIADPRTNKSIFRPYRDTRFSKDKTPYKTHLGIFMWEGNRPKMECSGFYFHVEPPDLLLAAGIHCFPNALLSEYRDSVVHDRHGSALAKATQTVYKENGFTVGGQHYKKTPRGYDPAHKNTSLLLHNGLYAMHTTPIPEEFYSGEILDFAFERFKVMLPIHRWLVEMTARASR
jgi:uncharacterized protein (TIGR02453 family)